MVEQAMRDRLNQLTIAKTEKENPDAKTESLKAEIIKTDDEIQKLMEKLADADSVLFSYIQNRVEKLHEKKSEYELELQTRTRKKKKIDVQPLTEPMSRWDELSVTERHNLAVEMIDVVYISDETGIDIRFSV